MNTTTVDILLVEDNPADVELTLHVLREENLSDRVHVARDGEEALDFLLGRGQYSARSPYPEPKLVLLDLKLPKVDGLKVLRTLKSNPRTRAIPVTILSSSAEEPDLVQGYALGANSYVRKPVNFDDFRKMVRNLGLYWLVINYPPPAAAFLRP